MDVKCLKSKMIACEWRTGANTKLCARGPMSEGESGQALHCSAPLLHISC